jgi:uncharacterized protein YeeX (DUF496 family)
MLKLMEADLSFLSSIRDNDRRILLLASSQTAYLASKLGEEKLLTVTQLKIVLKSVEDFNERIEKIPCEDADISAYPPPLDLRPLSTTQ